MEDIRNLFKETIAEFIENGLKAELEDELGYSRYDYKKKAQITAEMVTTARSCGQASMMWKYLFPATERENLSLRYLRRTRQALAKT